MHLTFSDNKYLSFSSYVIGHDNSVGLFRFSISSAVLEICMKKGWKKWKMTTFFPTHKLLIETWYNYAVNCIVLARLQTGTKLEGLFLPFFGCMLIASKVQKKMHSCIYYFIIKIRFNNYFLLFLYVIEDEKKKYEVRFSIYVLICM